MMNQFGGIVNGWWWGIYHSKQILALHFSFVLLLFLFTTMLRMNQGSSAPISTKLWVGWPGFNT